MECVFSKLIEPGLTGEIIPAGGLDAMAEATARWMDDGGRLGKVSAAALSLIHSKFRMEGEATKIIEVYDRLWQAR